MKKADVAWAAGVFEGEGCWYYHRRGKVRRICAQVQMTDRDVLDRLKEAVEMGRVSGPNGPYGTSKLPRYTFIVSGRANTEKLFQLFSPWLSPRRSMQGQAVLDKWDNDNHIFSTGVAR